MKNSKNILSSLALIVSIVFFVSCEMFKIDNYDEPSETLRGVVKDVLTGDPVLTDQTDEGIRIRLQELSWTDTETPETFGIRATKDGTYQNTKLFAGHYNVRIDGPFIPLTRNAPNNVLIVNGSKDIDIKGGVTVLDWEVQPFLRIEWVGEPTVSNRHITASFRVTRAVSVDDFREKMQPVANYNANWTEIMDIRLFVGQNHHVGLSQNVAAWSVTANPPADNALNNPNMNYNGSDFEPLLGEVITVTTPQVAVGRTVFIRAAARIRCPTDGVQRYNYNAALRVDVP